MCGIAGIYHYRSHAFVDEKELLSIRDAMTVRGPDGSGFTFSKDKTLGLAHRRLSIVDLDERATQPLISHDGQLQIVFNGEIYNYQILREALEKKGFHFRTTSDTEVLLYLYRDKGTEMLNDLRGMFAFGIWDESKQVLFLARDTFGIKPLYYLDDGDSFKFASQVKALKLSSGFNSQLSCAGQVGFFSLGYVPEPFTIYQSIHALPAGSYLLVQKDKAPTIHSYQTLRSLVLNMDLDSNVIADNERNEYLHHAFSDSVKHHLIADVPVGVFLSAGIDSSCLLGFGSEYQQNDFQAITLGFDEYKGTELDEVPLSKKIAKYFNAHQSIHMINEDDFASELSHILHAVDQPSIDGVNVYFVARAAAQSGLKVALSGLGGDELLGGYPSFTQIPKIYSYLKRMPLLTHFGSQLRVVSSPLIKYMTSPKYAGLFEYGDGIEKLYFLRRSLLMPWELPQVLSPAVIKEGWNDLHLLSNFAQTINGIGESNIQIGLLEMEWYMRNQLLRDADWAGMAHSIEIRVPFVDVVLFKQLLPLMKSSKPISKMDMARAVKPNSLPQEVIEKRKTGFATPIKNWIDHLGKSNGERGLRGWSKIIFKEFC